MIISYQFVINLLTHIYIIIIYNIVIYYIYYNIYINYNLCKFIKQKTKVINKIKIDKKQKYILYIYIRHFFSGKFKEI